ncbi:MAG: toll/interleukin-1 receptor domain-containing protein [Clostridia bacterium]|nr:toll/interleukin-1 receptor domain-containing protein [Clostridia bacterium]
MALDEKKILKGNFIFVSYNHLNANAIEEDMKLLLDKGVRLWYDINMKKHLGEKWIDIVKEKINHPNCVGVLFYNSTDAFVSPSVQKEQEYVLDRLKKGNFKHWSVNLEGKQTFKMFNDANNILDTKEYSDFQHNVQRALFNDDILCIQRTDSETTVKRIIEDIAVIYGLIDNEETFIDHMQKNSSTATNPEEIILGRYISGEYIGPEYAPDFADQRFGITQNLIQLNQKRYFTKELKWKLLYVKDNTTAVLLCIDIICNDTFESGLKFLTKTFIDISFLEEEKKNGPITARYLTQYDIERCQSIHRDDSLKPVSLEAKHWWIDIDGLTSNWKQTIIGDYCYSKGFVILSKKGIRPVIEIPISNID